MAERPIISKPDKSTEAPSASLRQVLEEVIARRDAHQATSDEEVMAAHSELMPELGRRLRALRLVEEAEQRARSGSAVLDGEAGLVPAPALPRTQGLPTDLFPDYDLIAEIHRGGQGVVYKAHQRTTHRDVALKVMREGPFHVAQDRARFDREIRVLAQLKHPNIVAIHHSGVASGHHYFVMDYIAGQPLDTYAAIAGLSMRRKLLLFAEVCKAVNAAHLCGVIHRDLKPGNILVDSEGTPYILDFGLAKFSGDLELAAGQTITRPGQFLGTLQWCSPEQANDSASGIDLRTDVYSLGVILYQLVTRKFPYEMVGNARDLLDQITKAEPAKPSTICKEVNAEVETIVMKCLSKERERRYQTAGELARDIGHYLAGEPIDAKQDSTWYVLRKRMRRYRVPMMIAMGFIVLLIASSIGAWTLYARSRASLWESYLAQGRAQRFSGRPGRRVEALEAIAKAAAMRPSLELRNEAIACLALTDVRIKRTWPAPVLTDRFFFAFDSTLTNYCIADVLEKTLNVHRVSDGARVFRHPQYLGRAFGSSCFSTDGRYLACEDVGGVELWDISRQRLADRIPVESTRYLSPLSFSPDDRALAIGTQDGTVVRYELATKQLHRFPPIHAPVNRVIFSPDGTLLATSSIKSKDVVIREAISGDVVRTLAHPDIIWSLAWSQDGRRLAAGCEDYNVYVSDVESGDRLFTLSKHWNVPINLAFDDSGSLLLSTGWDSTTRLWDLKTGEQELVLLLVAFSFKKGTAEFAFSTTEEGGGLGIAEIVQRDAYREVAAADSGRSGEMCQKIAIRPDGRLAASTTTKGWRLWDLAKEREIAFVPGPISSDDIAFHPSGTSVFTASESGVQKWKLQEAGETIQVGEPELLVAGYGGEAAACSITSDGRRVLASAADNFVYVHDLDGAREDKRIGPHAGVSSIDVSPDNRWLASSARLARDVEVWEIETGALVRKLPISGQADVAFSPDGRWLVTSAGEHVLWDAQTWQTRARLPGRGYMGSPSHIAFSPDSSYVAVSGEPGIIQLIETQTFTVVADLECPQPVTVPSLAFSPDGTRLIVANPNGRILHVWNIPAIRRILATLNLGW